MADLDLTRLPSAQLQKLTLIKPTNLSSAIIQFMFVIAGVLFFLYFLTGAAQWVASGGDKEGLDKASKKIKHALIGLFIVLGIYGFGAILNGLTGVDLFRVCFPGPTTSAFSCPPSGIGSGGGGGGGGGGGPPGTSACRCFNGGCASVGQIGYFNGGCYRCTTTQWDGPIGGSCPPISCGTCN